MNFNNISFQGLYVTKGTKEEVNLAEQKLKTTPMPVSILNIPYKKNGELNQLGIIATNKDAIVFNQRKKEQNPQEIFSQTKGNVFSKCGQLIKKLMGISTSQIPIIEATTLLDKPYNIYSSDSEVFSEGKTLDKNRYLNGAVEKFYDFGQKIVLTKPDGTIETTLKAPERAKIPISERLIEKPNGEKESYSYQKDGSYFVNSSIDGEYFIDENGKKYSDIRKVIEGYGKEYMYVVSDDKSDVRIYLDKDRVRKSIVFTTDKNGTLVPAKNALAPIPDPKKEILTKNSDGSYFVQKDGKIKYINRSIDKNLKGIVIKERFRIAVFEDNSAKAYENDGHFMKETDDIRKLMAGHFVYRLVTQDNTIEYYDTKSGKIYSRFLPDKTEEVYENGKITRTFKPNGEKAIFLHLKDGGCFVDTSKTKGKRSNIEYFNKNIQKEVKSVIQENSTRKVVFDDDSEILYYPEDVVNFDGNKEFFGINTEQYNTNGTRTVTFFDGTIRKYETDDKKTIFLPDGTIKKLDEKWNTLDIVRPDNKTSSNIPKELKSTIKTIKQDSTFEERYKKYKSAKMSLIRTIAWELSDKTKEDQALIAKDKNYLIEIFQKREKISNAKAEATFDNETPIKTPELSTKEKTTLGAYQKECWQKTSTEEFSQNTKIAIKAVESYILDGISSIEDEKIKTVIENWAKQNPKKNFALFD